MIGALYNKNSPKLGFSSSSAESSAALRCTRFCLNSTAPTELDRIRPWTGCIKGVFVERQLDCWESAKHER